MKIVVLSDTHLPSRIETMPESILKFFKDVDMILHAGDLVELSVLDSLKSICPNVKAVWGNMDPVSVRECLPEKEIISVGKYRIGLTHGNGPPSQLIEFVTNVFKKDKVNIIVFGHSHYPINEKKGKILYFNPGSLTDKIFAPFNSYGIIEIDNEIKSSIIRI